VFAAVAIVASVVRALAMLQDHAARDAAREAELDEWAYAPDR
jgi:hypothetical protein